MNVAATVLIVLVAALHLWFLILEMLLWQKPIGLKIFNNSKSEAKSSATLAANMGLYNGFLAAGLIWSLIARDPSQSYALKVFFLSCVIVAGVFGGLTANRRILYVQALPAVVGLLLF